MQGQALRYLARLVVLAVPVGYEAINAKRFCLPHHRALQPYNFREIGCRLPAVHLSLWTHFLDATIIKAHEDRVNNQRHTCNQKFYVGNPTYSRAINRLTGYSVALHSHIN